MVDNNSIDWAIIISLLGGGAMGAVITTLVNAYRNKIQPVGKRVVVDKIFQADETIDPNVTGITVDVVGGSYVFKNLYIANITLVNRGNNDLKNFKFGITLPNKMSIKKVQCESKDRHHKIETQNSISFDNPSNIVDFNLEPFNRKDIYKIKLYITISTTDINEKDFQFSSEYPIKFIDLPTPLELAGRYAELILEQ